MVPGFVEDILIEVVRDVEVLVMGFRHQARHVEETHLTHDRTQRRV